MDEKEKQTLTKLQNQLVVISCFIGFKQTSKIYTCAYSRDNIKIHPQKKKKKEYLDYISVGTYLLKQD